VFSWKVDSTAGFFSPESTNSEWMVNAPSFVTSSAHHPSASEKKYASPSSSVETIAGPVFGSIA
jgi:hypothetical protein